MRPHIVIADDHPLIRLGTRSVIEGSAVGDVVAEANNADELLEVLTAHPCDVLVTDLAMPHGGQADGLPMIGAIRRRHPEMPIVLLTQASNLSILRMALSAGVLGLVDKGSTVDELPLAIQSALRGAPYVSRVLKERFAEAEVQVDSGERKRPPSAREMEVLRLLASGMTVTEIAARLHRSVTTISRQKGDAMRKLGIRNDAELFEMLRTDGFAQ
ncbi:response regulator transcription factor [Lysobacter sp. LF1]|uniref:Response regulator transcription factor n=1 Tax=Lysobacter stagni TaxID=3045172 RepID=A0ABT6XIT1_9GAMM|nr:response regulator transcription factor [Lysobacter sp. LF1]MDI9239883.1 response regulator transcription factor [Lysobacter sp. LF1]